MRVAQGLDFAEPLAEAVELAQDLQPQVVRARGLPAHPPAMRGIRVELARIVFDRADMHPALPVGHRGRGGPAGEIELAQDELVAPAAGVVNDERADRVVVGARRVEIFVLHPASGPLCSAGGDAWPDPRARYSRAAVVV